MFGDIDELKYGSQLKTVRLKRRPGESFGFALRGGREHKLGFFVTQVQPGSESELRGLTVGDQVIRINGMPVEEALHKEMLNMIRSKTQVTLKVRSGGLQPFFECTNPSLPWQPARPGGHPSSWSALPMSQTNGPSLEVARVTLTTNGKGSFGCSVCEGPPHKRGIYIQSMDESSVARMAGIRPGDQILQCNSRDFTRIHFYDAVKLLKESSILNLVIAKGAGSDFISPGESSGYNSAASSVNGDHSPVQNDKKRLSVVREEIIDIIDERRGLVVGSVTVDCRKQWNDLENEWDSCHDAANKRNQQRAVSLLDEEKRLQEERLKIEEAQRKLQLEAERLALERRRLEETRQRLLSGSVAPPSQSNEGSPPLPPKAPKAEGVAGDRSVHSVPNGINAHSLGSRVMKDPIHQQHEQLMEEFKEAHKKMFSSQQTSNNADQIGSDVVDRVLSKEPIHNNAAKSSPSKTLRHTLLKTSVSAPLPPPPPPLPPCVGSSVERNTGSLLPVPALPAPDYEITPTSTAVATTLMSHPKDIKPETTIATASKVDGDANGHVTLRHKTEQRTAAQRRAVSTPVTSSPVRISIGTYPSQQVRPQPTRLDFLPAKSSDGPKDIRVSDGDNVKALLQKELSQTLSRARLRQRLPDMELNDQTNQTDRDNPAGNGESTRLPAPTRQLDQLTIKDSIESNVELKSRVESGNHDASAPGGGHKMMEKLAAGRASTVAVRKSDPVSIFTSTATNTNIGPAGLPQQCPTVVIVPRPEEIVIGKEKSSHVRNHVRFSTSATVGRKPAPEIQARLVTLGSADKSPSEGICQSADNKVTIQVSSYSSVNRPPSHGGILKPAGSSISKATGTRSISFGKTTYIDSIPITEL